MKIPVDNIVKKDRYRKDLGDLTSLKKSFDEVGLLHPIVVKADSLHGNFILIAGERRLEAWKELKLKEIECHVVDIKNLRLAEIHENEERQDFLPSEEYAICVEIRDTRIGHRPGKHEEKASESDAFPKGDTIKVAGKLLGKGHAYIFKLIKVFDSGITKWMDRVDAGTTSVDYAERMVTKTEAEKEPIPLPEGEFDIIYADPPWHYDLQLSGAPDYPTMKVNEICDLKIPSAEDAVLFLWTTGPKLEEAFTVINAWGFTYKTFHIWAKINNTNPCNNIYIRYNNIYISLTNH